MSLESKDRSNTLLMRAKRPVYQNFTRSCVLNFEGRSVKSSKKNIQIEYKSRLDNRTDRCRVALQHAADKETYLDNNGVKSGRVYILDFTYPFSPIQAFAFALGTYHFKRSLK